MHRGNRRFTSASIRWSFASTRRSQISGNRPPDDERNRRRRYVRDPVRRGRSLLGHCDLHRPRLVGRTLRDDGATRGHRRNYDVTCGRPHGQSRWSVIQRDHVRLEDNTTLALVVVVVGGSGSGSGLRCGKVLSCGRPATSLPDPMRGDRICRRRSRADCTTTRRVRLHVGARGGASAARAGEAAPEGGSDISRSSSNRDPVGGVEVSGRFVIAEQEGRTESVLHVRRSVSELHVPVSSWRKSRLLEYESTQLDCAVLSWNDFFFNFCFI